MAEMELLNRGASAVNFPSQWFQVLQLPKGIGGSYGLDWIMLDLT